MSIPTKIKKIASQVSAEEKVDVAFLSEMGVKNPSTKGNFDIETFTYGSGTDAAVRHQPVPWASSKWAKRKYGATS